MMKKIVELLRKHPEGLSLQRMSRELHLVRGEMPLLKKAVEKLENRGLILQRRRRYSLRSRKQLVLGTVLAVHRGYAWVRPEEENSQDIFIPARFSGGALLGDTVEVIREDKRKEERPEGRVLRIIERKRQLLTGMYKEYWGQAFFQPYESPSKEEIPILVPESMHVNSGQIIEVDRKTRVAKGVLGGLDDPGVDIEVIVRKFSLRRFFPPEVSQEAEKESSFFSTQEIQERKDYRDWVTFTIDGEDARDFDDAVSIKRLPEGRLLLGVHIADVSHYVRPGSALDQEAFLRGCSVYFPETVLPMLPEKLSNEICSLRPDEDRLTFSVLLEVDAEGDLLSRRFYTSIIRSDARLTYSEIFQLFEGKYPARDIVSRLQPELSLMRGLAEKLRRRRLAKGSLNIVSTEPFLIYQDAKLVGVDALHPNEAHGMIEEFMLAANESVALHLAEQHKACIFRAHPAPSIQALVELRALMVHFGVSLPEPKHIGVRDLQKALERAEGQTWERFFALRILRSLKLAIYSTENQGHFGLGKDFYLHFTSPIRRYPDLLVHRCLKKSLKGIEHTDAPLKSAATWSSERERQSEAAEKELKEWRIYRLLHHRLGDTFLGFITDINKAGLVVELIDYFVNGIILYQDLGKDYYVRKSEASISGRKTGETFTLGDRIRVSLVAVDPELRRMTLVPALERDEEKT